MDCIIGLWRPGLVGGEDGWAPAPWPGFCVLDSLAVLKEATGEMDREPLLRGVWGRLVRGDFLRRSCVWRCDETITISQEKKRRS